jgi:hypothetical protein
MATAKTQPDTQAAAPQPAAEALPQSGGSYLRAPDGALQPEAPAQQTTDTNDDPQE